MIGRVTQGMLNSQLLRNLNTNLQGMEKQQEQLSSGRRINRPSDDPVGITYSMRFRSEIAMNEQHQSNADAALSWLEYSDVILDQANDVLHRVRELSVKGADGSNPSTAMEAIASEMKELKAQLVSIANSEFNGKHVFNGQMTDRPPYSEETPEASQTDTGQVLFEVGTGVRMAVNVTGNEVFGGPEEDNVFAVMNDIIGALEDDRHADVSNALGRLDDRMDVFLEVRADIGAKTNRIELAENRLKDASINLQQMKSKVEDADMAQLITNLKTSENVYQASLSTGARIISASLVDFLK